MWRGGGAAAGKRRAEKIMATTTRTRAQRQYRWFNCMAVTYVLA